MYFFKISELTRYFFAPSRLKPELILNPRVVPSSTFLLITIVKAVYGRWLSDTMRVAVLNPIISSLVKSLIVLILVKVYFELKEYKVTLLMCLMEEPTFILQVPLLSEGKTDFSTSFQLIWPSPILIQKKEMFYNLLICLCLVPNHCSSSITLEQVKLLSGLKHLVVSLSAHKPV